MNLLAGRMTRMVTVVLIFIFLAGCSAIGNFSLNQNMKICRSYPRHEAGKRVEVFTAGLTTAESKCSSIDMEGDDFCTWSCNVVVYNPLPVPANIPDDAIIYALKEFAGYSGTEPSFDRMVRSVSLGLADFGHVNIVSGSGDMRMAILQYVDTFHHLVVKSYSKDGVLNNALDLSDVDVSLKTRKAKKLTEKATGSLSVDKLDIELRKLKKLLDDGILTEEEFRQQKQKIMERN